MLKVPSICPVCGGELRVEVVKCRKCNTTLQNQFGFSVFEKLNDEQTEFVLTFLKCEGSIKEMEKYFKVSYPTIKSRLQEIKRILDLSDTKSSLSNIDILDMLSRGEITPEQAAEMIKNK
ncbi:MAG TPA: DUF2089 domain-containing protein [Clostridia bacterium]